MNRFKLSKLIPDVRKPRNREKIQFLLVQHRFTTPVIGVFDRGGSTIKKINIHLDAGAATVSEQFTRSISRVNHPLPGTKRSYEKEKKKKEKKKEGKKENETRARFGLARCGRLSISFFIRFLPEQVFDR